MTRRWLTPLGIALLTRGALIVIAWLGLVLVPVKLEHGQWSAFEGNRLVDGWCRWDSGWYSALAKRGYTNQPNDFNERDTSFFPLYPLGMRLASTLLSRNLDQDVLLGGLLVSHVSFLAAVWFLYGLAQARLGPESAPRAVFLLAIFPFSLFFSAVYTESLFLALATGSFYFAERRNWLVASLLAAGAAVTRVPGCLIGLALAVLYLEQRGFRWRHIKADILFLLTIPTLLACHCYMLWQRFGDPLAFLPSAQAWRGPRLPEVLRRMAAAGGPDNWEGAFPVLEWLQILIFVLALGSCWAVFARLGKAYGLWCLAHLLVSLGAPFAAMGRFISVLFPLFMVWARLPDWLYWGWVYLSTLLLGLLTYLFTHWGAVV